jgi:para-nitrobenzyl esterase
MSLDTAVTTQYLRPPRKRRVAGALPATTVAAAVLAAALTLLMTMSGSSSAADAPAPQLHVATADGKLVGTVSQGAREFLGVPYAAPPVYEKRFAPPAPVTRWKGTRDATKQAPACIQFQISGVSNAQATSEDCLYLDVYTPADARPKDKLPVIFWMHGGGNTQGSGVIYGGQRIASLTHSIFVSINYRLGAFGWLTLPQFSTPQYGPGNFGLLDQIAALKWVNQNIGAFGGDAGNITIDGQSAGSSAVCNMLASPFAKGLFERGILESGPCSSTTPNVAAAEAKSTQYLAAAGCTDPSAAVACLRGTQPYALATTAWTANLVAAEQKVVISGATAGTPVLPVAPGVAISSGNWNKVPLIIGSVRNENKLLSAFGHFDMTADEYADLIRTQYGDNADAVLAHYPAADYPKPFYALAAVGTDAGNACRSYWLAQRTAPQVPTYEEQFDDPTSPTLFGFQPPGIDMSSAHSAELAYLWNFTLGDRPLTTRQLRLGKQMDRYWAAFATSGNPQVAGQTAWPPVTASSHPVLDLRPSGNEVLTTQFPVQHQCAFWATVESTS